MYSPHNSTRKYDILVIDNSDRQMFWMDRV
jgi:hypothetical protein